jgi:cellulose synthase operon protein C
MRLACENCAAAYIIEDGAMTPRGVRAQCPRCRNIQYVPPPQDVRTTLNPAARAREMANPISVSRPPVPGREPDPEPPTQVARVVLATRMVARPPVPPPEALLKEGPEARAELFGELSWNDGELTDSGVTVPGSAASPASAPPRPDAPLGSPAATLPSSDGPGRADNSFVGRELFGSADASAPLEDAPPSSVTCATCGAALGSFEDVASGVCTSCRATATARLVPPPALSALSRAVYEPPPPSVPTPAAVSRRTPAVPRPVAPQRRRWWATLGALAAVVLLGAGALLWLHARRGTPLTVAKLPVARRVDPLAPLPTGLQERLAAWRTADLGAFPSAPGVLVEAQREIALDQPAAYASALRQLQRALVDAPRDPEVLGAWLSASALGRGATMDPSEYRSVVQLAQSAVDTGGHAPAVLLGLAELRLVPRGQQGEDAARALAQEALAGDPASAQAHLVLARTYVRTSAALALGELQRAEQADPSQRRIPLLRAEAYVANGQPREALAAFSARLALEPDHAASLFATGRLLVEVGEPEQARRLFERLQADPRTEDGPALLALAELDSLQGRPREAMQLLHGALKRDRLTAQSRVRANVLLAGAARAAGDADGASSAARAALATEPADPGAHLELLLVALDKGNGAGAEEQLSFVLGKLSDPGLEGMVEGWVRMAQKQTAAAAEAFERTAQADPRRTDALLWAAAAHAVAANHSEALTMLAKAEEADPTRAGPFSPLSELSLWPEDSLRGVEKPLAQLAKGTAGPAPRVGEAVLRFHRRDFTGAGTALGEALKLDAANPQALAWRALVLLELGDVKGATTAAELAQQGGRALPIVHYAAGVAALAAGDLDAARRLLREAVQMAPTLLAAEVKLAEAEARAGAVPAARERLRKVVQLDPSYASAKRALYLLPKES